MWIFDILAPTIIPCSPDFLAQNLRFDFCGFHPKGSWAWRPPRSSPHFASANIDIHGNLKGVQGNACGFSARASAVRCSDSETERSCSIYVCDAPRMVGEADVPPVFLVGLSAPYYTPLSSEQLATGYAPETQIEYDRRVLSTPLIWEEPRSFFFECSLAGLALWSEDAMVYGKKALTRGLQKEKFVTLGTEATTLSAEVSLSWTEDALTAKISGEQYVWELSGQRLTELSPTVAFLTEDAYAGIR